MMSTRQQALAKCTPARKQSLEHSMLAAGMPAISGHGSGMCLVYGRVRVPAGRMLGCMTYCDGHDTTTMTVQLSKTPVANAMHRKLSRGVHSSLGLFLS